ncbi:unnamed protein product [Camellia sinensis]
MEKAAMEKTNPIREEEKAMAMEKTVAKLPSYGKAKEERKEQKRGRGRREEAVGRRKPPHHQQPPTRETLGGEKFKERSSQTRGSKESKLRGMTSIVLERAETLRTTGASIGMQSNGWQALNQLGVGLKLRQTAIPVLRILVKTLANELPVGTIRFGCQIIDVQMDPLASLPILQLNDGTVIKAK